MKILFVTPRFPYPPHRGYQLRAYHQIRLLSSRHQVTLVSFSESTSADSQGSPSCSFNDYCHEVIAIPYRAATMLPRLCTGLMRGRPLQTSLYETSAMRQVIARLLRERRHDLIHVQLCRMAGLVENATQIPRVMDFVDALSSNFRRRAAYEPWPAKPVIDAEAIKLLSYEREICRSWDCATTVSAIDRAAIGDFPNLSVNSSGVDLEAFPYRADGRDPSTIIFTGNMGYFPNIDAISWFVREIFPRIVREEPNVKLLVVGSRPGAKVKALAKLDPRVRITGRVEQMQPYLRRCTVAIAPMRAGSGQLFKLLEAMSSGAPLVATSLAADATEGIDGRHLLVADDAASFARSVLRLVREPALASALAREARQLVEHRYRWERVVAELEEIYRSVLELRSDPEHRNSTS